MMMSAPVTTNRISTRRPSIRSISVVPVRTIPILVSLIWGPSIWFIFITVSRWLLNIWKKPASRMVYVGMPSTFVLVFFSMVPFAFIWSISEYSLVGRNLETTGWSLEGVEDIKLEIGPVCKLFKNSNCSYVPLLQCTWAWLTVVEFFIGENSPLAKLTWDL